MQIISGLAPGALGLTKYNLNLSREARVRLEWFNFYYSHGCNARLTCRHFCISPQTFYRWLKRYDPYHPQTLESHSPLIPPSLLGGTLCWVSKGARSIPLVKGGVQCPACEAEHRASVSVVRCEFTPADQSG